jgi:serine/threonine-protein kinase
MKAVADAEFIMDEGSSHKLGNYELIELLGRGGMTFVYRAYQPSMKREVAIKLLKANLADEPGFLERFNREAEVIARLQHPHILPVIDYGHTGESIYLVMRLVQGGSLDSRIKEGPFSLNEVNRILCEVASALSYAHRQNVIHRDLKPPNILLDEDDNTYLTDFGIAKLTNVESMLTATDQVMGTPAYMSPEQGLGLEVDARADVYALGLILFEMLTGKRPFKADNPTALIFQHVYEAPPLPSSLNPQLPAAIDSVVLKALEKEAEARYITPSALADAFAMTISPMVTLVTPPTKASPPEAADAKPGKADAAADVVVKEDTILLTTLDGEAQITTEVDSATASMEPSPAAELSGEAAVRQVAAAPRAAKRRPGSRRLVYLASVLLVAMIGLVGVLAGSDGGAAGTPPAIIPEVEYMSEFEIAASPQRAVDFYRADGNIENAVDAGVTIKALYIDETGKWVWVRYANNDRSGWVSVHDLDFSNPQDIDKLPVP